MGDRSGIEWTEATWNPIVGCSAVSPGCDRCYAASQASTRLAKVPAYAGLAKEGVWTGELRWLPERLGQPSRWRRPRRIFVNSMSDLFHADVLKMPNHGRFPPLAWIVAVMVANPRHTFQVLTKRPQIMARVLREPRFALDVNACLLQMGREVMPGGMSEPFDVWGRQRHIWWGTSIEHQRFAFRASHLLQTPAAVRWVSAEPLLGPLDLTEYLHETTCDAPHGGPCTCAPPYEARIDWLVVGGESGRNARIMHPQWARDLRDQAAAAPATAFLFKQWGEWAPGPAVAPAGSAAPHWFNVDGTGSGTTVTATSMPMYRPGKKAAGRLLDGRLWDGYPA